ncbi:hypothetical protein QCA50_005825 [Cerrena zonata]|uniref:Uncharacterized protein n=1 Tax=Cerrena zonata TaxID=2478898 RepID=A0AAW0GBI2_9APHY
MATMVYFLKLYLSLAEAALVLLVIYLADQAINHREFELQVDFSELFPMATATQSDDQPKDVVVEATVCIERILMSASAVMNDSKSFDDAVFLDARSTMDDVKSLDETAYFGMPSVEKTLVEQSIAVAPTPKDDTPAGSPIQEPIDTSSEPGEEELDAEIPFSDSESDIDIADIDWTQPKWAEVMDKIRAIRAESPLNSPVLGMDAAVYGIYDDYRDDDYVTDDDVYNTDDALSDRDDDVYNPYDTASDRDDLSSPLSPACSDISTISMAEDYAWAPRPTSPFPDSFWEELDAVYLRPSDDGLLAKYFPNSESSSSDMAQTPVLEYAEPAAEHQGQDDTQPELYHNDVLATLDETDTTDAPAAVPSDIDLSPPLSPANSEMSAASMLSDRAVPSELSWDEISAAGEELSYDGLPEEYLPPSESASSLSDMAEASELLYACQSVEQQNKHDSQADVPEALDIMDASLDAPSLESVAQTLFDQSIPVVLEPSDKVSIEILPEASFLPTLESKDPLLTEERPLFSLDSAVCSFDDSLPEPSDEASAGSIETLPEDSSLPAVEFKDSLLAAERPPFSLNSAVCSFDSNLKNEAAPFSPGRDNSLPLEDLGLTAKTLLNEEFPLVSKSLDELSFGPLSAPSLPTLAAASVEHGQ